MTPGRLRLLSLLALAVPVGMTALAGQAGSGFTALALASAAAGAALLLAGRFFRVVLAVLLAALGGCVIVVAVSIDVTADLEGWLVVGIVAGILQVVVGILIAITSPRWPTSGRKYTRTRASGGDAIDDWDALSAGDDPTDAAR